MISPEKLGKMKNAFNGLSGRLSVQKKLCAIALERLEEEERKRDELEAACAALTTAIRWAEEAGKQKPAPERSDADSRNSSRNMAGELEEVVPAPAKKGKKRTSGKTRQVTCRYGVEYEVTGLKGSEGEIARLVGMLGRCCCWVCHNRECKTPRNERIEGCGQWCQLYTKQPYCERKGEAK